MSDNVAQSADPVAESAAEIVASLNQGVLPALPSDTSHEVLSGISDILKTKQIALIPFVKKWCPSQPRADIISDVLLLCMLFAGDPEIDWAQDAFANSFSQNTRDTAVSLYSAYMAASLPSPAAASAPSDSGDPNLAVSWLADTVRYPVQDPTLASALSRGAEGFKPSDLRITLRDIPLVSGGITAQSAPVRRGTKFQIADSELYDHCKTLDALCGAIVSEDPVDRAKAVSLTQHLLWTVRNWRLRGTTVGGQFKAAGSDPLITSEVRDNVKNAAAVLKTLRSRGRGRGYISSNRGRGRGYYRGRSSGYQQQQQQFSSPQPREQLPAPRQSAPAPSPSRYGSSYQRPRGPPRGQ